MLARRIEIGSLAALAFFLPLLEAPKNLAWLAYLVCWIFNRVRARDFGGRWDLWDTLIAAWIASGFAAAAFAGLHGDEWRGSLDLLRYGMVLWLVKRSAYSKEEIRLVLGALVASTVIGLAVGFWRLQTGVGKSGLLQLYSVGHVNHTAIYLAIMLGLCVAWLFSRWQAWRYGTRAVALAVVALVLVSLIVTESRGAIAVGLAMLPALAAAWWPRWRTPLVASVVAVMAIVVAAFSFGFDVVRKHQSDVTQDNVLAFRDGVWRMGLAGWERFPVFGVGMDNYSLITLERVKTWREEAGKDFDAKRYVHFPHGHSVYVNTLAERGSVGFGVLAAVILAWAAWLVRWRPRRGDEDFTWLLWGGAASAWAVTFGAGLVNTTLHHEHGILAVLLFGLWLSWRARLRAS